MVQLSVDTAVYVHAARPFSSTVALLSRAYPILPYFIYPTLWGSDHNKIKPGVRSEAVMHWFHSSAVPSMMRLKENGENLYPAPT